MNDVIDIICIKSAIEGISEQISTAINIDKVNKRVDELPKENLLINWYFPKPINQRNARGTVVDKGYFIDRWKLIDGQVEITSNGLVLNGTIHQILEFLPTVNTVATVLTSDGLLSDDNVEYDASSGTFQITASGETLVAAKLEIGQYQTLIDRENHLLQIPDASSEMLKCKRYYQVIGINSAVVIGNPISPQYVSHTVNYPVLMRTTPSYDIPSIKYYQVSDTTSAGWPTGSTSYTGPYGVGNHQARIFYALPNGITLKVGDGIQATLIVDAEL